MNKTIPLCLILLSFNALAGMDIASEIKKIILNGENSFFIHIGNNTKNILMERKTSINDCTVSIKGGDAPSPIGTGKAKQHAIISCKGHKTIGLRLNQANIDHYHILGYWTINGL